MLGNNSERGSQEGCGGNAVGGSRD
jgi:hypothetical protein